VGGSGSGRRPKPTEQKQRLGNPGKRKLAQAEVIALPVGSPVLEAWRPFGDAGSALWTRIWTSGAAWLKPAIDGELALMVCEMTDERVRLRAQVFRSADDWRSRRGLRELDRQIASLLGQLGFSPTDRATLGVGEVRNHEFAELHRKIAARRSAASE
jgi:hypothetical protein